MERRRGSGRGHAGVEGRCNLAPPRGARCAPQSPTMASVESTSRASGSAQPPRSQERGVAPLGAVTALSSALALAAFAIVAGCLHELLAVTPLPAPLPDHHQHAETLTFVITFVLLLPLGIVAGSRIADRLAIGANGDATSSLAALLCLLAGLGLIAVRVAFEISPSSGTAALIGAGVVWMLLAALAIGRAAGATRRPESDWLAARSDWVWAATVPVTVGAAFTFATIASISWPLLCAGAAVVAGVLLARERLQLPRPSPRLGRVLDLGAILLLLAAVPNLVLFGDKSAAFENAIINFHQDFYLGPANQVMTGHPMLVDTLSQYGVGSILFLTGIFELIPIGNRSLALIEGLLSAGMFIGAYATLRIAGVRRLLAAATLAVAVIVAVYGLQYPLGGLLQHGAFRFGLPIGVVVGAVAEARWPQHLRAARALQLLTVAIASIWALEAFAYTLLTLFAVIAFDLFTGDDRRRRLGRWILQVAAACLLAHLVFALATLISAGELPDWGWYLNTLREFLTGKIGDLTYDFAPFSAGLALGAIYLISATGLVLLLRRRPGIAEQERVTLVAITAMTAFGVALFSYIVNRSADHIIPYVSLPAFSLGALWLSLLDRPALAVPGAARRVALGLALAVSALLVALAASAVPDNFSQSALALARPGGASLRAAVDQILDPPPLGPASVEGEQLLDQYMPGESNSVVITQADPSIAILINSGRGNAVPLGDPWEDSFVPNDHLERLGAFVDGLEPGDRMLIDQAARDAFESYQQDPALDPLAAPTTEGEIIPSGLASLQLWVLDRIGQDFDLHRIASSPGGLEVVELEPRQP
jgi:hypothetical protein